MSVSALVPAAAHADSSTPTTIYVDVVSKSCSDSGPGTEAAPFCTLQAAVDATVPGDTVMVEAVKAGPVTVTESGTADAPITIEGPGMNRYASETMPQASTTPAFTLNDVSYVNIANFEFGESTAQMVYVNGSNHITLDDLEGGIAVADSTPNPDDVQMPGIEITGSSSAVTLSRSKLVDNGRDAPTVQIDAGSSDDVITTNGIEGGYPAISVDDSPGTDIVSNTILYSTSYTCGTAVELSGASTGSYIENNIMVPSNECDSSTTPKGLLSVDQGATSGTTVGYNVLDPNEDWSTGTGTVEGPDEYAYEWGGQFYRTVADFAAASGQGSQDVLGNPQVGNGWTFDYYGNVTGPTINSANSNAPGEMAEDLDGRPRVDDPLVPDTGAGTYTYYDRGAAQIQATLDTALTTTANGALGATVTSVAWASTGWSFDFGDGSAPVSGSYGVASHTYAKPGTYTITVSGTSTLTGQPFTGTTTFTTAGSDYTPTGPTRILDTRSGLGAPKAKVPTSTDLPLKIAGVGSIPANATAVALNVTVTDATGNGYVSVIPSNGYGTVSNLNYGAGQTVSNSVIVPVGPDGDIGLLNMGAAGSSADLVADVSGYFTQSAAGGYTAVSPDRILDTRNGTGAPSAKVAPNHGISVGIAGADSIPADVTAVALHVTVTDAASNGWIAAEPDGAGTPSTSILNFGKGQTISNTVIVPVAADGKIELYNGGGTGSVDLVGDVAGYFSAAPGGAYTPVQPYRSWDSRNNGTALGPDSTTTYSLDLSQFNSQPQLTIPAGATLVTNITVTDTSANGFLSAYPAGTTRPGVSNLNYGKGQTIGGLSVLATTGPNQQISIYNQSTGRGDVILDVFGYFSN